MGFYIEFLISSINLLNQLDRYMEFYIDLLIH